MVIPKSNTLQRKMGINQDNDYKKLFQITKQNRKKRNSAITRILLDKKLIWQQFWRFTLFDIGDIFKSNYHTKL